MFLFKQNMMIIKQMEIKSLHYSMFLFKQRYLTDLTKLLLIYITVCFYLNSRSDTNTQTIKTNLHYNMFLFKRYMFVNVGLKRLHLYYNMFLFKPYAYLLQTRKIDNLHYNMFLFKPKLASPVFLFTTVFTLQYVSI